MSPAGTRKPRGFTLVELLVVVSIIALLIAILLPSLRCARKQAKAVLCLANLRSLSSGAVAYASEWYVYPPSLSNFMETYGPSGTNAGGLDWLGIGDQFGAFVEGDPKNPQTGNPKGFAAAPYFGVVWQHVGNEGVYLCPEDRPGRIENSILGGGGNGRFSYTMFSNLGLRPPSRIPARMTEATAGGRGATPSARRLPKRAESATPLFVEEHPTGINDRSSTGHMEGNFNYITDFVVSRHGCSFSKRPGRKPGSGTVTTFAQGTTNIGFADGHVEPVKVNYGLTSNDIKPAHAGGGGLEGIPYTAEGLLYYYGIEYNVIEIQD
ncbi:MAG: type II secretion system protein [Planctomycetota bacterium]|jgi:prepilin-type N-terminal cleavage/methylation domain-containing protein/prepilin-type processing-associated H-X9-DG protein